jgi:HAE1 family hydrophobic/amphiphilic exporter-1
MKLSHFFIDRPIFAAVVAIFITLIGGFSYFALPVAQYPEVAPPTVVVKTSYPGASAQVVSESVATPLEQQINGVENMLYMVSQATGDGNLTLTITFKLGTDLDIAQVLVQNRVSIALSQLPQDVVREGVTVKKNSPDMLMVIHLISPDGSRDQLYISNYATLQIKDVLARLEGVGDVVIFGARDYAMRIWVNPNKIAARRLTAGDIVAAVGPRTSGRLGRAGPAADGQSGRLPAQCPDPGAPDRAAAIRQYRHQYRCQRAGDAAGRRRPDRARRPGLRRQRLSR